MNFRNSCNFIKTSLLLGIMCQGGLNSGLEAQEARWDGPIMAQSGWVYTDAGFVEWIWCGSEGRNLWVYAPMVSQYLYMPASQVRNLGGWAYAVDLEAFNLVPVATPEAGWYWFASSEGFVYATQGVVTAGSGWVYLANTGNVLPLAPEEIILQASHVANHEAETIGEKYADAIRLGADYVAQFVDYDTSIQMTSGAEGITFKNTLTFPGGAANRYVRIGLHGGSGYMDFNSLTNISGYAGVVVHADVDLTGTTNGFYVRLKEGDTDVAAYTRLSAGVLEEDILLEPYLTNQEDNAYIEITLPWQGSVTIKDIYLYMDSAVRGFDTMESLITGGAGATPENTHTVTNAAEFVAALAAVRAAGAPSIIYVAGTVSYDDWVAAGQSGREATLNSSMGNLSIIGVGTQGLLDGVGLAVQTENVIIQNLTVRYVLARDAIQVNNGRYVKIDHCTLYNEPFNINPDKDKFDELISIKNDAMYVIVSWNEIYDSHKTILVGSNDGVDAIPDRKVIFHHNWFHDGGSRHPLYRGGYAHVYNNYYEEIGSGINVRTNAKMLIENNYFENVDGAIGYWFDTSNPAGGYEVNNNIFVNVGTDKPTTSTLDIVFDGDYQYTLDPVGDVPAIVTAGAGVGKL